VSSPPQVPDPSMADRLAELAERRSEALQMGGPEKIAGHHASGRLTVRERIERLVDPDSWFEIGLLAKPEHRIDKPVPGDGVVTGYATVDGRRVGLIGIDATVLAGTTAPVSMRKQGRVIEHAQRIGFPIVVLADADGGRIPDVMGWRFSGLPFDFRSFLQAPEGIVPVPRAVAVLGPSYGDAALHAASADFVVMTRQAALGLSGPSVVGAAVGEELTDDELGGADVASASGSAHLVVDTEDDAFSAIRTFLSYMPDRADLEPPRGEVVGPERPAEHLAQVVPLRRKQGYDMVEVLLSVVDGASLFPWRPDGGGSVVTALARLDGHPVGVVASQPAFMGGVLDPPALAKVHDFVDLCDSFGLALVFLHDVPGLMVGSKAERDGVLRWYEKVAARIAAADVPKVGVVIRKAYGGGHYAMGGGPTKPDFLFCWPTAELGFMAPEPGVATVHRRHLDSLDPERRRSETERLLGEWADESEPWEAAAHFYVDDVIAPVDTRDVLISALRFARADQADP
jgi:acetyl-CoA carboxylase carboxyltransferase component